MTPNSEIIRFGEWAPDLTDLSGFSAVVTNVLSNGDSYKPLQSLSDSGNAVGKRVYNGFSMTSSAGVVSTFVATEDNLFLKNGTSWTNVSKTDDIYTTAADGRWEFLAFGDTVLATNFVDAIQSYVVGTSTDFADLAGSPPKVKHFDIINNFVVTGNNASEPQRVRWSGIDDPTTWAVSAATQADFQDVVGTGGAVQAIVGSQNFGVVVQERNIWRMEFVGPPTVFNFSLAESNRGTHIPGSVVSDGNLVYYWAEDGFFVFDGTRSIPIGDNKVDDTLLALLDQDKRDRVSSAVDPSNKIVVWSFPSSNAIDGEPDTLIIYNWVDQRWTLANVTMEVLFQALSDGFTLEQLDSINSSIDLLPASLDSTIWSGGLRALSAFSPDNKLATFTGANLNGIIDTTETRLNPSGRSFVTSVTPVTDNPAATVAVGTRKLQSDTVSFTGDISIVPATGECPFRSDNTYHRARVKLTGNWTEAIGVRFRAKLSGVQ